MNGPNYVVNSNITRFQKLLETSIDDSKRQTIQKLLAEEKEKAKAALQASKPLKT